MIPHWKTHPRNVTGYIPSSISKYKRFKIHWLPFDLSLLFIAVIKTITKSNSGLKEFNFQLAHIKVEEVRVGNKAEVKEEKYFLACSACLLQPTFLYNLEPPAQV
jgi:hypothetical protein